MKKTWNKKTIIAGTSILILTVAIVACSFAAMNSIDQYDPEDVVYTHEQYEGLFKATKENTWKGENGRNCCRMEFQGIGNGDNSEFMVDLPESDYRELMGEGTDSFASDTYKVTFSVSNWYRCQYIEIYRYAFLGQKDFTKEEIKSIAQKVTKALQDSNQLPDGSEVNERFIKWSGTYGDKLEKENKKPVTELEQET